MATSSTYPAFSRIPRRPARFSGGPSPEHAPRRGEILRRSCYEPARFSKFCTLMVPHSMCGSPEEGLVAGFAQSRRNDRKLAKELGGISLCAWIRNAGTGAKLTLKSPRGHGGIVRAGHLVAVLFCRRRLRSPQCRLPEARSGVANVGLWPDTGERNCSHFGSYIDGSLDLEPCPLQTSLPCASSPHGSVRRNACPKRDGRAVPSV